MRTEQGQSVRWFARWRRRRWAFGLVAALALAGCSRKYFRLQANKEVDGILTEKNCYPDWSIEAYHLPPDPRARFAAPYKKYDFPPMPPDDPAAKNLSPNPQKPRKGGVGNPEGTGYIEFLTMWDAENRANLPKDAEAVTTTGLAGPIPRDIEPADRGLETREKGFLLNMDQACELALFNSREFQDRREDLYLAALPVTLQRFAFTYQFFATETLIREHTGEDLPEGLGNRWRANTTAGFSKLFCTGALLMFRFANQVVVNMAAKNSPRVVTPSNLSLDFVQPLLQGGGKAVTMEPLTQAERDLLYVIRAYARFREEFYAAIAGGGEFGRQATSSNIVAQSAQAPTEGFLPTLLRAAQLENEKQNVVALESIRALYNALLAGGDVSQLQVDQVELALLNSRASVLQQTQLLRDALDRFKQQLGVPVSMPIELDNSPLQPLIDQTKLFLQVVNQFEEIRNVGNRTDWPTEPELLRERLRKLAVESPLTRGTKLREEFASRWAEYEALTDEQLADKVKALRTERRQITARRSAAEDKGEKADPGDIARITTLDRELDYVALEQSTRRFLAKPWDRPDQDEARKAASRANAFRDVISDFVVVLGDARAERLEQVRGRWPKLPDVRLGDVNLISDDLDQATAAASQAAINNRFDLMNVRGFVVDAWRKIAVRANALFGVLDVAYHLDSATFPIGTQPFDFRPELTRHQLIINGELPLVRQAERNAYVTSLIVFQRLRRTLQASEDQVLADVRSELRQLRFLAENYKIQQRSVELAYYQVESSLNVLQAPPRPAQPGQGSGSGSDAGSQAALTQQLLNAVQQLLRSQNQLYATYQNFLVVRMFLYRDLEMIRLDRRGVWIDELSCSEAQSKRAAPVSGSESDGRAEQLDRPRELPPPVESPQVP